MRRFRLHNFAFARHGPAQERRIHQIRTGERHEAAEYAAKSQLAQRFRLYNQQTGKA